MYDFIQDDDDFARMAHEGILDRPDTCDPLILSDEEADASEMQMALDFGWCPFSGLTPSEFLASRETLARA